MERSKGILNTKGKHEMIRNFVTALRATLLTAALGSIAFPVLAVHDLGFFELDGDATNDTAIAGDDWSTVNAGGGSAVASTGVLADPAPLSIFTGGGSKDIHDITQWLHKNGSVPDKDDLTNAYAAAYVNAAGEVIVIAGADRFANNGDAMLGFWFLQDDVGLNADGTFRGAHRVGDILILANFVNGGSTAIVEVLEWVGSGGNVGSAGTLQVLLPPTVANCGSTATGDVACGIVNDLDTIPAPWPYTPKSGPSGSFPPDSFFEVGINLTSLLGAVTPCFQSFLAESRASSSEDAVLKDLVAGAFPFCEIAVSKVCEVTRLTDAGDNTDKLFVAKFSGQVTNSGGGSFPAGETVTIIDDAGTPNEPADDVEIVLALDNAFLPGESLAFAGEFFTDQNPPTNTVVASATLGGTVVDSAPFSVQCVQLVLNPAIQLAKQCVTALQTVDGNLVVRVDVSGSVANAGDVPLSVTVEDDKLGILLSDVDLQPGEARDFSASYFPSAADGGETDPGTAAFSDTVTAVGTNPAVNGDIVEVRTATCPLCP